MTEKATYEGIILIRGKGTGFVSIKDAEEDIVIPNDSLSFALNGDLVEIELGTHVPGKRQEGRVLRVIEPAHEEFVGTVERKDGTLRLAPDNRHIHIRLQLPDTKEQDVGKKVVARIRTWKNPHTEPVGEVTEVIGMAGEHETEMRAILRNGGFSENFPEPIAAAAQELYSRREELFNAATADPERKDMRGVPTMTIDPADAKDFDDALSFRPTGQDTVEIGIHIADVSYYVKEGDVIDMEARERGTSIYLVDRVIPMLPEVLSNDLCSLRPGEDRLAFSAIFTMDRSGHIKDEWYGQTIIHSDKRFTYEDAQAVLDTGEGTFRDELADLMRIARTLRKKRYAAGAIAFEQPEVKFELDENGKPLRAYTKERTETMLMIEDFMLLANRKVSEYIYRLCKDSGKNAAFVYRVHDTPDTDKIEELALFLRALGYDLKTHKGVVDAKDINRLLKEVDGTPEEDLVKTATIRSMAKAVYTTKNIGHFGLAFKYYTHFTSPIRRYPDLMVHRLLRRHLDGSNISGKELAKYEKLSIQSSEREANAVSAERTSIKLKQVELLANKVGEEFDAVITGVADWGIYVEDTQTKAEGMIKLASMKSDYFEHQQSKYRVKGQRTGVTYQLGDKVRVRLIRADVDERQLDFELVDIKKKNGS